MQEKYNIDLIYRQIGKNVRRIRKSKGISQAKLSTMMGLKPSGIVSSAEICANGKHFNIEHLIKISFLLQVPLEAFFEELDCL